MDFKQFFFLTFLGYLLMKKETHMIIYKRFNLFFSKNQVWIQKTTGFTARTLLQDGTGGD
jgi:hypothetical protein